MKSVRQKQEKKLQQQQLVLHYNRVVGFNEVSNDPTTGPLIRIFFC